MKKTFLSLAIFFSFSAFAQTNKTDYKTDSIKQAEIAFINQKLVADKPKPIK